jgi:hypothetical protein
MMTTMHELTMTMTCTTTLTFFRSLMLRAFLAALAMLYSAAPALASPIQPSAVYRVSIDTASLAGRSGYLDFLLLGLSDAAPVQVAIGGFAGAYAAGTILAGDAGGSVAGGISLGNGAAWNEFAQWAEFGGVFSFSVRFTGTGDAGAGTNLGIALLDADFNYLGTAADVVTFALQPGMPIAITADAALAAATALPEPSTMLQVATGLMLLALCRWRYGRSCRISTRVR